MSRRALHYGYIRASTIKQEDSPDVQKTQIEDFARADGISIDVWVTDVATSGSIRLHKREAGGEMLRSLRKGDTVWVAKIDRAWRSVSDCCLTIERWARHGVGIRIADRRGQFDLTTPGGKAFIQMMAVFAELERGMISMRTKEALAARKRQGTANCRYPGYGFSWRRVWDEKKQKYIKHKIPNHPERAVMAEIVKWRMEGHDFETIYRHMRSLKLRTAENKEWGISRIQRAFLAELGLQQTENKGRAK